MRILVSVDIEGASGIVASKETQQGQIDYDQGRRWLTADCNAVIEGVLDADPNATLVLHDSHGLDSRSILMDELHPAAEVVRGKPVIFYELRDLERHARATDQPEHVSGYDAAFMVGMHDRSSGMGILSHVLNPSRIKNVWINGEPASEGSITIALAAHFGIPTVFVSGDQVTCSELSSWMEGEIEAAVVKESYTRFAARCLSLKEARDRLRTTASAAVRRVMNGCAKAKNYSSPVLMEVELDSPMTAYYVSHLPTIEWEGHRNIRYTANSLLEAFKTLCCVLWVATSHHIPE